MPWQTLRAHQKWMLGKDIQGRIYISAQGINAQYSGRREDALAYAQWVGQQPGFEARFKSPHRNNLEVTMLLLVMKSYAPTSRTML